MVKTRLIISIIVVYAFLSNYCFAQITLTSFPVPGDTIFLTRHSQTSFPMIFSATDQTGSNHVWDFSSWTVGPNDTIIVDNALGNALADSFPDADIAFRYTGESGTDFFGKVSYLKVVGNDVVTYGSAISPENAGFLANICAASQPVFSFPVNTGNSFSDTSVFIAKAMGSQVGLPYDSVMQIRTVFRQDTIDGYGQLQLSGYSLTDLYRDKITDNKIDSMFFYSEPLGWQLFQTKVTEEINVFWLNEANFFTAWMEAKNDTVLMFQVLKYNPTIRLELVNLQAEGVQYQPLNPFEVRAYRISDNSLATNFNDIVSVVMNSEGYTNSGIVGGTGQAVSGVATFANMYFTLSGNFDVIAISDTAEFSNAQHILIHPGPDSLDLAALPSATEGEVLPPFEVRLYNTLGILDSVYTGNVNIGKLAGSGKITGTLSRPLINGVALFDDIVFNHNDNYKVVAWIEELDTIAIDSGLVSITPNANLQWSPAGTDTLSEYIDRASFFVWTGGEDGYLSGTSRAWYDHIAQHFTFSEKGLLTKVIMYFAQWQQVNSTVTNDTYKLKIYDAGVLLQKPSPFTIDFVTDSLPIGLLAEQVFPVTDVHPTDFFVRTPTVITFDTPVEIYSDFIVALEVNSQTTDDTIVLWTSINGDGLMEKRSLRHTIDYNAPFMVEGWVHDLDWRPVYNVDNMIMPVIDVDTMDIITSVNDKIAGVSVYPNPCSDKVYFRLNENIKQVDITDLTGKHIRTYVPSLNATILEVELGTYAEGIYIYNVVTAQRSFKGKLHILR